MHPTKCVLFVVFVHSVLCVCFFPLLSRVSIVRIYIYNVRRGIHFILINNKVGRNRSGVNWLIAQRSHALGLTRNTLQHITSSSDGLPIFWFAQFGSVWSDCVNHHYYSYYAVKSMTLKSVALIIAPQLSHTQTAHLTESISC